MYFWVHVGIGEIYWLNGYGISRPSFQIINTLNPSSIISWYKVALFCNQPADSAGTTATTYPCT